MKIHKLFTYVCLFIFVDLYERMRDESNKTIFANISEVKSIGLAQ